jgi:prevent-host-death family protein
MRVVTITEAKNGLSSLIDVVQSGDTVLIVDRGRPVARLETAISASVDDPDGRLARLQRAGLVHVAPATPAGPGPGPPPQPREGASALAALVEERRGGR